MNTLIKIIFICNQALWGRHNLYDWPLKAEQQSHYIIYKIATLKDETMFATLWYQHACKS